ncbi:MAG: gliding motility-associated C-terminal domain-containing protein [Sphingobacteriales bacterium]|nr:gliding motility-associated C-terminal domain-containing protein [Sphingobacteriales bacterium]
MKPKLIIQLLCSLVVFTCINRVKAQSFGTFASAVWISNCSQSNFYNTSGSGANLIGPSGNSFDAANLGVYTQNSGSLIFRGGEVKTFKTLGSANVCGVKLYYRVYAQSSAPGAFSSIDLPLLDDCDVPSSQFPSGGPCTAGDQKWQRVIPDGTITPYAPVNLTTYAAGDYYLELYYEVTGYNSSPSGCSDLILLNNSGSNYKASFSIQSPTLSSTNPVTCNGNEGSITIGGLVSGSVYSISYTDDGSPVGPLSFTANGSGQVIVSGLNAGIYSNINVDINGCSTNLFTGVILSNPIFSPSFSAIAPFCAGTTAPVLSTTSNNGITGTWSPATVSNAASGTYTFTPTAGQCGIPATLNITVIPRTTPTFTFGISLSICNGGTVPTLPNTSTNFINGTWSPSTVSNTASGTYTFTPNSGQCANNATFTVTVNPIITPTFAFGTSLTICSGGAVPALPATSGNGINGTWSPSTVDNTTSGTYTFTPGAGQCATTTTFNVTVNPIVTPSFAFGTSLTICNGGSVPTLPATSTNGITGTWSPSTVDNTSSGTYTFTPTAGQCATSAAFNVTVSPNITPTFAFGTSLTICSGATVPILPTTSSNGISGTWSPSAVDNTTSGTYTFTPTAGQCATTATFNVTVNPNITPSFAFGTSLTICSGGSVPALPATSSNGINGTWSPSAVDNTTSGTYTFTPTAGQCATTTTFNVTVNPIVTPSFAFGTSLTICNGGSVPTLPATSTNGITGTWNPSTVDNTSSGTYTFTPTAGQCATSTTFNVTVNPNITPTFSFGTSLTICSGGSVPTLPATSSNGINGTWNPSVVNNTASGTYTFTPTAGQCATTTSFTVTVNPIITPAFDNNYYSICANSTAPVLATTSNNGITGTWSPATVSNTTSALYTFTPAAGQCATTTTVQVDVIPNITPTFDFGTSLTICSGGTVPDLSGYTSSNEGITGTWSPASVSNTASATYTFTPDAGQCATTTTFTVTVNPIITPTFSFGTAISICNGATAPTLPGTSGNGITGSWSPSAIDNTNSGTYTFTPAGGQCAVNTTLTVTVNPILTPTFSFGTSVTICSGTAAPVLPNQSTNGVNGTWIPAIVDNQANGTYTFTPNPGECAVSTSLSVTVTPSTISTFSFGTALTICSGGTVPVLPTTSNNGVDGVWNPATVSNTASGVYTFTPNAPPQQCFLPVTFTVTVNPVVTPAFSFGTSLALCSGSAAPALPATSTNGINGTWSPATIDNANSGTYTFTPSAGQCANGTSLTVTVNPIPTLTVRNDTSLYDKDVMPLTSFTGTPTGVVFNWTNSNPAIGLSASGTGSISSFNVINQGSSPISGTITVTPVASGCSGTAKTFTITVKPLDKDVFVPNVFSPNGDGKNDFLFVYGNYIQKLDMRIFNQWGEQIAALTNTNTGWDGKYKGKPQPVGVYVYVLRATLTDGRTVNLKGSITLVR